MAVGHVVSSLLLKEAPLLSPLTLAPVDFVRGTQHSL